jgi:hypothetical protein
MRLAFLDRPWSLIDGGTTERSLVSGCGGWLYTDAVDGPIIDGRRNVCCREFFVGKDEWTYAIPVPLRTTGLLTATAGDRRLFSRRVVSAGEATRQR